MITNRQKIQLEKIKEQNFNKTIADQVNVYRIQKRISRELNNGLWLAENYLNIFFGKAEKYKAKRLRQLLMIIKTLNPKMDVELVLQNLPVGELKNNLSAK